jgi:hypothetical protein
MRGVWLTVVFGAMLWPHVGVAQRVSDPNEGNPRLTQWGVMDGNRVRTLYANHGEIARWPDQPSGEWPRGSGHSYVDGVAFVVSTKTEDAQGELIYPMSTNYREDIDRDPVTQVPWGWAPVPGYSNRLAESPARSDDPTTWPSEWPDRPIDWAGQWNGFFGRGVQNADLETYFVFDDAPDREWTRPPHNFYPCPGDESRGGLGLEVAARGFQWSHPLAQDVIFWIYEITNECAVDYDEVYFAQFIDWGIGGTDDSGDDEGAYNTQLDLAFAYDFDGVGSPGAFTPVGTAGYAFLESPGNSTDGVDNDEDGITDERRDNGPGTLIEGQENIRAYAEANYDFANFERFYGPIDQQDAYRAAYWWTGDENMSWRTFTDLNENGQWDDGEPLNDDVGFDGLAPEAPNYPGRDQGEGDGRPSEGEPNFDALDKDESDQIGLTGFQIFNVHDYELIDDEEDFELFAEALPPLDDIILEGGRNLAMFFASGPFPLRAGQTERFSMALLFADRDFGDPRDVANSALARKKQTVQQIYNANYRFARPPDKPTITATPGDGQVTLTWDEVAERSYDPFLREFDFEGYLIYRSTEPNFRENLTITDAFGNEVFQRPLAQYDLANGLAGPHPVAVNGVQFNLGTDSGLRHSYVDRDVINGKTYYYAVVAYDRGFLNRRADGSVETNPDGTVQGISPSLTTANIKNDVAGNLAPDINTAVATPRAPAAGYVPPEIEGYDAELESTGTVDVAILSPAAVVAGAQYELTFENPSVWNSDPTPSYTLRRVGTEEPLAEGMLNEGTEEIPPVDGFAVTIQSPNGVAVVDSTVQFVEGEGGDYRPEVKPSTESNIVGENRFIPLPNDFEVHVTDAVADTSLRLAFGLQEIPVPFYIDNLSTGQRQDFILVEDVDSLRNQQYDPGELIILVMGETPDEEPVLEGGRWKASWSVRLARMDPDATTPPVPPPPGTVLRFRTTKPFQSADRVTFALSEANFNEEQAREEMDDIFVVPNPYVSRSAFEPANTYRTGRGERRIYFMNLPPECTIRIYTVTGQLVQTLEHSAGVDDGQEPWDLTTKDGMNLAYGVYIYHVDAPGVGEFVDRFAVIK